METILVFNLYLSIAFKIVSYVTITPVIKIISLVFSILNSISELALLNSSLYCQVIFPKKSRNFKVYISSAPPVSTSLSCHGWIQLPASSAGGSIQPWQVLHVLFLLLHSLFLRPPDITQQLLRGIPDTLGKDRIKYPQYLTGYRHH